MVWNLAATIGATLLGLAGVRHAAQEPYFDFDLAAPQIGGGQAGPAQVGGGGLGGGGFGGGGGLGGAQSGGLGGGGFGGGGFGGGGMGGGMQLAPQSKPVSCHFQKADMARVLGFLEENGVSFIVNDFDLKDHTVTININNQPIDTVVEALGSAMGGHWDRHGNIWVYSTKPMGSFGGLGGFMQPTQATTEYAFRAFGPGSGGRGFVGATSAVRAPGARQDWDGFRKSLTYAQRDLLKSQGYLKLSDLTTAQLKMVGLDNVKGNVDIEFKSGSDSIKIKSGE